jgi:hypothetical protein
VAPFEDKTDEEHFNEVVMSKIRPPPPSQKNCLGGFSVSEGLWDLIMRCWRHRPEIRLNIKHVLAYYDIDPNPIFQPFNGPHFVTKAVRKCWLYFTIRSDMVAHPMIDTARNDNELSYRAGDVIEIMRSVGERWLARGSDGFLGCALSFVGWYLPQLISVPDVASEDLADPTLVIVKTRANCAHILRTSSLV